MEKYTQLLEFEKKLPTLKCSPNNLQETVFSLVDYTNIITKESDYTIMKRLFIIYTNIVYCFTIVRSKLQSKFSKIYIPDNLSSPLEFISNQLYMFHWHSTLYYTLYNYSVKDPNLPLDLDNIIITSPIFNTIEEKQYILNMVQCYLLTFNISKHLNNISFLENNMLIELDKILSFSQYNSFIITPSNPIVFDSSQKTFNIKDDSSLFQLVERIYLFICSNRTLVKQPILYLKCLEKIYEIYFAFNLRPYNILNTIVFTLIQCKDIFIHDEEFNRISKKINKIINYIEY
jgi:hypothetical protein